MFLIFDGIKTLVVCFSCVWIQFDDDDSATANDDDDDDLQPMYYHKSKNLNVSALYSLHKSARFNDIEVDTNVSTIHVPTHVYDECTYRISHLLVT